MPVIDTSALVENRVRAIRDFHESTRIKHAELDVSGGIDSAVMLQLLCRAIPRDRVCAVYTGIHSSVDSRDRARAAAESCSVPLVEIELTDLFEQLSETMLQALARSGRDRAAIETHMREDPTVLGSFRSCLRAPIGRGINRMTQGGLRHGTGNECEDRVLRFYQKGGDGEVDSNPIDMLAKGEVFQLARALEVPESIRRAVPSPDLHGIGDNHNDEDELEALYGVSWTYSRVDAASGHYTRVGSIERLSRLLDEQGVEATLFGDSEPADDEIERIVDIALGRTFRGFERKTVHDLLVCARYIERTTRHKANPNCPSLGTRRDLLTAGILDDAIEALPISAES